MASEIRVDKINSLSGVGTVTLSPTGVDIAGITTAATLRATTGIVTSLTSGSLTSLGAVSGTTGTFSGAVSGTTGTFSAAVSGTTGTFTGDVDIASSLVHTGDTDTKLTFTTDNISLTTGGTTRVNVTSSGNLEMPNDNDYLKIGASGDLALVHNGSASYVQNSTGFLQIQSDGIRFDNASGTERARVDSSGNFLVGGTSLGAADSFGVQPSGHFRHISASGGTGDTLLGAIDGVSNGFQVNISGTNVQKYKFHNGSTQTVQIDSDGLKFMNDTAAANALDDYEEGTFTMTMTPSTSGTISLTTVIDSLRYTKIGNLVTIHGRIRIESVSNPVGGLQIGGLPFASIGSNTNSQDGYQHFGVNTHGVNFHDSTVQIFGEIAPNATGAGIFSMFDNANWAIFDASLLQGNTNEYFGFTFFYHTAT